MLSRSLFLVPYDTDFNQEPCLRKGHRAHWALIIGKLNLPKRKYIANLAVGTKLIK